MFTVSGLDVLAREPLEGDLFLAASIRQSPLLKKGLDVKLLVLGTLKPSLRLKPEVGVRLGGMAP